jgi:dihydropyrimidine dehydrogenase (NAD+) subunit PreA
VACRDTSVHCIHTGEHPLPKGHRAPTRDVAIARAQATGIHVTWADWDECTGCNLCSHVCPVPGCITMVDDTRGKPFESWNDRIAKGTAKVPGGLRD